MIFHVFIQPDYMYALLKELTNNYHKNVKCRVQKLNTLEFVLLPSFQKKTKGLVIYFQSTQYKSGCWNYSLGKWN